MIATATPQLLELAEAMRGEDWADDLAGALIAATHAGWDWPKRFRFAARLLADEGATPQDMRTAVRNPVKRDRDQASPEFVAEKLAEMRSALPQPRAGNLSGAALAAHQALEARLAAAKTDWVAGDEGGPG